MPYLSLSPSSRQVSRYASFLLHAATLPSYMVPNRHAFGPTRPASVVPLSCLRLVFFSADVWHMFEEISCSFIASPFSQLHYATCRSTRSHDPSISVLHPSHSQVVVGGRIDDPSLDRTIFFCSKLLRCVTRLLSFRLYQNGDPCVEQVSNMPPIGGHIRTVTLYLTLCNLEQQIIRFGWDRIAASLGFRLGLLSVMQRSPDMSTTY